MNIASTAVSGDSGHVIASLPALSKSEEFANSLKLQLAWKRTKKDLIDDAFVRNPFLVKLIEIDTNGWLEQSRNEVAEGKYIPAAMLVCDVPKPKFAIRPGSLLSMNDRLLYSACLGNCLHQLHATLGWSQDTIDYGHSLASDIQTTDWIKNSFRCWKAFRRDSLKMIATKKVKYVVFADVVGFYEDIDIALLISDLKAIEADPETINCLSKMLNRWAQFQSRGIPQSCGASHLLAKLYLNVVDQGLVDLGFLHKRYVDDIRIFCSSLEEAQRALIELTSLLRKRGLNLNSSKSAIFKSRKAIDEIDKVQKLIRPIESAYIHEAVKDWCNPYMTFVQAERLLARKSNDIALSHVKSLYQSKIMRTEGFDKTIFNFLITRLARFKDLFAVEHCCILLAKRPELTRIILKYLESVKALPIVEDSLLSYLDSKRSVYKFQTYEIIEWMLNAGNYFSVPTVSAIRIIAFSGGEPSYLTSVSRAFLGKFGTAADIERLWNCYDSATSDIEKAEIICSIKRLEPSKRNAFLGRVERDCDLTARAVKLIKTNSV